MASGSIVWIVVSATLALAMILLALGAALAIYQRRFVTMHRSFADRLLTTQEQERAAVAREVHDDALQRIMILMQDLDDYAAQPAHSALARGPSPPQTLRADLEDLSAVLRQMAYRLHPAFHHEEGIVPMLKRLAAEVNRGGVRVEVHDRLKCSPSLTADRSLVIYRIAQEALANVVRHAGDTWAKIDVAMDGHDIEMTVEDYGTGFDAAAPRHGLGLISMGERARVAGGTLAVDSHPGGGTRITLRVPSGNGAT